MQRPPPAQNAIPQQQAPTQNIDFQQQVPTHHNFIPYPPPPGDSSNVPPATPMYANLDPTLGQNGVQHDGGQAAASAPSSSKKEGYTGEVKARLRKACDVCSKRKVKCDDSGPPCKPCRELNAECTYDKPSKRRGPPNKHAEGNKKVQYDPPGLLGHDQSSSPTHAAQTLASFSQQQVLSAEAICPMPILIHLMDDYFTLIHPLIPVPHEVSFRNAFNSGEATRNTTFLALLASMVGCVAAAYPQRPQQHSQALRVDNQAFPNHMSLVDRCFKVITQAQGDGYLDGPHLNVHDAQVSYLQGLTSAYTLKPQSSIHHFKQCIAILQRIGAHKASTYKYKGPVVGVPQARMTPNGETLQGPQPGQPDLVIEEVTKRTFWAMFVTARSIQQSGVSPWDLTIPPSNPLDPYPSLPLEIDDPFLMHDKVLPMPPGLLSATSGFNTSVRIFIAYNDLASIEAMIDLGNGINGREQATLLSRPITALQESIIKIKEGSLLQVQQLQQDLPPELSVNLTEHVLHSHNQNFPTLAPLLGVDTEPIDYSRPDERNRIALDVQKADIKHSIISTRLYLGR